MKCPECVKEGERSIVHVGATITTCMAGSFYYDEDGHAHSHDPNGHSQVWRCSRGHSGRKQWKTPCGAKGCDYNALSSRLTATKETTEPG